MDTVASGSRSLADWLADDFVMIDAKGQPPRRRRYLATQRAMLIAFPDLTERVEALHADFDAADVLWMRSTQSGHPRRGRGVRRDGLVAAHADARPRRGSARSRSRA